MLEGAIIRRNNVLKCETNRLYFLTKCAINDVLQLPEEKKPYDVQKRNRKSCKME